VSANYLPGYEPSEADLIVEALAAPLELKIKQAVGLLQLYEATALQHQPEGYWLAYSGGKDSDCILELAKIAGVRYKPVYNVTTIDPPELVRYIKREHPDVEFNRPKVAMLTKMIEKHPPTRLGRWCCEKYKEQGGNGYAKIIGVRIAESASRAARWRSVVPHRKSGAPIICPIVYWTDEDVWEFHRLHKMAYCCLYDEGFKRLGCIGCPLAGPRNQAEQFTRWPRYAKLWRRAFDRHWARWHGVPTLKGKRRYFEDFGSAEGHWNWWKSGGAVQGKPMACQGEFLFASEGNEEQEGGAE
jgi:phosphoadenosine phosphosulfate reductase